MKDKSVNYGAATSSLPKSVRISALGLDFADLVCAAACVLVPPFVFTLVSVLLCFRVRFTFPRGAIAASSFALIPAVGAVWLARKAVKRGEDARWYKLAACLFVLAYITACLSGELIYWYFAQPFFLLDSLKTYQDINPSEVDGSRLMDAGTVHFSKGARLATDMAMSYTSWDIYCVAPITNYRGLPSQGSQLAVYDLWAVGVNCCTSGEADFKCGEYDNIEARAGLRQVSAEQRSYFRLAVQQAEAAYGIEATHPVFFYWVQDPEKELLLFFKTAFSNWVLVNGLHFSINIFCVAAFVVTMNRASSNSRAHRMRALNLHGANGM